MHYIKPLKAQMKLVGNKMAAGVGVRQVRCIDELRTRSLIPSHCPPEYDGGARCSQKNAPRRVGHPSCAMRSGMLTKLIENCHRALCPQLALSARQTAEVRSGQTDGRTVQDQVQVPVQWSPQSVTIPTRQTERSRFQTSSFQNSYIR